MTHDTKTIAVIATFVVAGAVGLAMLASRSAQDDAARARAAAPSVLETRAQPASMPLDSTDTLVLDPAPPEVPAAEPTEGAFVLEPGVDPVARGLEHWNGHEYAEAAAYFRAATIDRPEDAWTHYVLALSLWKSGELAEADTTMQRAAELDPTSIQTFVNLSRIRNDRGEYDAALEAARAALALDGGSAKAAFLEGRSLRNLGRREEARAALETSVAADPGDGYAQNLLGLTLLELDRETEAVAVLQRAAELVPDVAYVRNNLGMAYERCGRRSDAVAAYREAVRLAGDSRAAANLARLDPDGTLTEAIATSGSTEPGVDVAAGETAGPVADPGL